MKLFNLVLFVAIAAQSAFAIPHPYHTRNVEIEAILKSQELASKLYPRYIVSKIEHTGEVSPGGTYVVTAESGPEKVCEVEVLVRYLPVPPKPFVGLGEFRITVNDTVCP